MAQVMRQLGRLLEIMNQNNNNNNAKETKLVDIPIFREGIQDPMTWLVDFQDACTANRVTENQRLKILPAYLKEVAHIWWMEISENLTNWNIPDDEDENNDEYRRTYF